MSTESQNTDYAAQIEALKTQLAELTARVVELEKHDAKEQEEIDHLREVTDKDHRRLERLRGSKPAGPIGL